MDKYNPTRTEQEIIKFWDKNKIYEKMSKNKGNKKKKPFYFLQGPPYTSGYIHLGTSWNNILKDIIIKYKKMQGFDVWDRAGWDMHGLPTANAAMKELGLKNKEDIEKFGIEKFVKQCKKTAVKYLGKMEQDLLRTGVWMDFKNAYMPINNSFMESVWWILKQAHKKNRLYEGFKVMTWCASCGTALAKHELEYETDTDTSVFLKLKSRKNPKEFLIIWTTTPWTIPFNLAVMVNPEIEYVKAKVGEETWIIAGPLCNVFMGVIGKKYKIIETFKGEQLEGYEYEGIYEKEIKTLQDLKKKHKAMYTVLLSEEYVDTSAGSGLVHCAPGCGPEDQEVGEKYKLPAFNELDENGLFSKKMGKFKGMCAKVDDKKFIQDFKKKGILIHTAKIEHEYAHCWRCHNPVIFRATKQWFMKVEDLKEQMKKLNKKVFWVPEWAGSNAFNSWINNLKDNSITRQRYWGTPAPIWRCAKCKKITVVESIKELKKLSKDKIPSDIHIPWIDKVTLKCKCGGKMYRIPDIIDVWIDSGATSFASLDYPHKKALFERYWPADFILEAKEQIRLWFNTLMISSMISTGKYPYKSVYVHGMINDQKGRKMSKSLGNYISPDEVIAKYGADTWRYYSSGGSNPGYEFKYSEKDSTIKYRNLEVLWNIAKYLKALNYKPKKIPQLGKKEKYMLSRLNSTIKKVTELLDNYKLNEVPWAIEALFLELSRWYIKAVREESDEEKVKYTIYNVLLTSLKMFSLIAPFISEKIYQNIFKQYEEKTSILLFKWPKANEKLINKKLEKEMVHVKEITSMILSLREKIQRGIRWPIKEVTIISKKKTHREAIEHHKELIKQMTNCLKVNVSERMQGTKYKIKGNFANLGPKFGKNVGRILGQLTFKSTNSIIKNLEEKRKIILTVDKDTFILEPEDLIIDEVLPENIIAVKEGLNAVYLETAETPKMIEMGIVRELIRKIQSERKKIKLIKTDKISLYISAPLDIVKILELHIKEIKEKVGAKELSFESHLKGTTFTVKGKKITIKVKKI